MACTSKEGYYLALRQTQGSVRTDAPNWQPWLSFFLRALQQQVRRLAVKVEREKIALAVLPELAVAILDHARARPRSHGKIAAAFGVEAGCRGPFRSDEGVRPYRLRPPEGDGKGFPVPRGS